MTQTARFPYTDVDPSRAGSSLLPYVPITLSNGQTSVAVSGLLDTGATIRAKRKAFEHEAESARAC